MRYFVALFTLLASVDAQQTFTIEAGIGASGWCDGFDMGPDANLASPTTAEECFNNCKQTYDSTIAVDFWPDRAADANCWCQDACECLKPALPDGGTGVLYIEDGTTKGPSCGYDLYTILENDANNGWCYCEECRTNWVEIEGKNNQHECWAACQADHGSVSSDFFPDRSPPQCFCESTCDCRSPSRAGGGDGYLALAESVTIPDATCYELTAGTGADGWCTGGFDSAPDPNLGTPATFKECFDNCKTTYPETTGVDFWDVSHPERNDGNICWCQDGDCPCTNPSKPYAGNGVLFLEAGTDKGPSCGYDAKTLVEGNSNGICASGKTPASESGGLYDCLDTCRDDGFDMGNYMEAAGTCMCENMDMCTCTTELPYASGRSVTFYPETMSMRPMCDSVPGTCGGVRELYRSNACCGMPEKSFHFHDM